VRSKITKALGEAGISSDKITPSKFSSTPRYGFFSKRPSSYEVTNLIKITIAGEKDFQEIARLVDGYKQVEYDGIVFERSDKDELEKKALEQACDDVLKKKAIYESKLGLTLIPKAFSEGAVFETGDTSVEYQYRLRAGTTAGLRRADVAGLEEPSTSFGEIMFRGRISVEYLPENK
jgi:hypothetical protein